MPLPEPNSDENEEEFMGRCMGDDVMVEDFPDNAQRYAVCKTQWEKADEEPEPEDPDNYGRGSTDAAPEDSRIRKHNRGIRHSAKDYPRHAPIRCFEGTAKPHEAFWHFRNAIDGDPESEPEMELYGYISEYSWFDDEITPKMFKNDLWTYGSGKPITIRINSGGGDVIAASVMKSILIDYPGHVTVKIDGLAASAATIVAIAGDTVKMQESAYFMIHDPMVSFMFAVLNIEEISRLLASMKTAKDGILDAYASKTGQSRESLGRMMTRETWMTANEAHDIGFVDEVITAGDKKKKERKDMVNSAIVNALHNYQNVPDELLARCGQPRTEISAGEHSPDIQTQQAIEVERLRAQVKLLQRSRP